MTWFSQELSMTQNQILNLLTLAKEYCMILKSWTPVAHEIIYRYIIWGTSLGWRYFTYMHACYRYNLKNHALKTKLKCWPHFSFITCTIVSEGTTLLPSVLLWNAILCSSPHPWNKTNLSTVLTRQILSRWHMRDHSPYNSWFFAMSSLADPSQLVNFHPCWLVSAISCNMTIAKCKHGYLFPMSCSHDFTVSGLVPRSVPDLSSWSL